MPQVHPHVSQGVDCLERRASNQRTQARRAITMYSLPTIARTVVILCLLCSACAHKQQQIEAHTQDIAQLHEQLNRTQTTTRGEFKQLHEQVRRMQAAAHSEREQLRADIQSLAGSLEENNVILSRQISELKERLDAAEDILQRPPPVPDPPVVPEQPKVETAQTRYDRALGLYYAREYDESKAAFQDFLKQHPDNPLAHNAFFWSAMCLFHQKKFQEAVAAFEHTIDTFPRGSKVPDAYYWQAMAFLELREMLTAQILLENLMETYPKSDVAPRARIKYRELNFKSSR